MNEKPIQQIDHYYKNDPRNPIVLLNVLYIPVDFKTGAVGLWKDLTGKIHRQNITLKPYFAIEHFMFEYAKASLLQQGQDLIFYKNIHGKGVIENKQKGRTYLENRVLIRENHLRIAYIKELLNQHGGLTLYRLKEGYLIEIYK